MIRFDYISESGEGRDAVSRLAFGPRLDQLADLVAVPRPRFQQRQDQQLDASFV